MKDILWKKLNFLNKIIFLIGWISVLNPIFWVIMLFYHNAKMNEKFWNSESYRIVYIFGLINLIGVIFILIVVIINIPNSSPNKYFNETENYQLNENLSRNEMNLYFYDNKTNCSLKGNISLNNNLVGETDNGTFILLKETYNKYASSNSSLSLKGFTDVCFGTDKNLLFFEEWDVSDLNGNFDNYSEYNLLAGLTPRQPRYYEEMAGFIRPEEVKLELDNIGLNFNKTQREIIDDLFSRFYLGYLSDSALFKENEYWQTPAETMKNKGGDCEDWAVRFVSLLRAYNYSLNCYVALWDTHANVLCRIDNFFKLYDQDKVTSATSIEENLEDVFIINQDNNSKLRRFLNNYFKEYGLSSEERRIYALFNDKEIIEFNSTGEFINWASSFSKI